MALDITTERVQAAAARLADGGWRFTDRQLYYAVCRDVEVPRVRVAPGELSLGVLLILVGAITGNRIALAALGSLGLVIVLVGVVTHLAERRPLPDTRVLPVSFDTFRAGHLERHGYEGLIVSAATAEVVDAPLVVVCDRADTAAMLRANASHLDARARICHGSALHDLAAGTRVVTVHDASPTGCALPADARDRGLQVDDAGLNPRDVIGMRLQVIEGAPARLPRDLSGHIDAAESDWLVGGRRLELGTLTPEEVVMRVRTALLLGDTGAG